MRCWCREQGHPALGLNVFAHNPGARALYDRLGYHVTHGLPHPRRPGCRLTPRVRRPQRRPRRGGHRRRRAARGRDLGQRRVRLPCRDAGDHARGLCRGRRGAASWSAPRSPTATGRASVGSPRTCRSSELRDQVAEQVELLSDDRPGARGRAVRYVKPHGALYHRVTDDPEQAAAVLAGSGGPARARLPGFAAPGAAADAGRACVRGGVPRPRLRATAAWSTGVRARCRCFGTRSDRPAGGRPGARVASLCVHGDSPDAVAHAHAVRRALRPPAIDLALVPPGGRDRPQPEAPGLWRSNGFLWRKRLRSVEDTPIRREVCADSCPEPLARRPSEGIELSYQPAACGGAGIGEARRSRPRACSRRRPVAAGGVGGSVRFDRVATGPVIRGALGAHTIESPSPHLPVSACTSFPPARTRCWSRSPRRRTPSTSPHGRGSVAWPARSSREPRRCCSTGSSTGLRTRRHWAGA